MTELPSEIRDLKDQLDAAERDSRMLAEDLTEEMGSWRAATGSWSVGECIDHLARTNHAYLDAMEEPAIRARELGRLRRGPAVPGLAGRWFAGKVEPPVKALFKLKAPRSIQPIAPPLLADALVSFAASQDRVREFLNSHADLDLAGIRFRNPFVPGIRFSLATGLHILAAHERRHLWQAWRVRRAAEGATAKVQ